MNLGAFAGGMSQGLDQGSIIRARKQQMEKERFELEQQKREMAARAAMFGQGGRPGPTGLPGSGGMPQPLPGMQGQPPSMLTRAGNWLTNQIGGFGGAQGGQPAGNPAMGGMDAPPLPQQGTEGLPAPSGIGPWAGGNMPKPVGNQADGGGGPDDFSLEGLDRHVQQIATRIRANNPGIDDETLAEAVTQYIATMGKVGAISGPEQRYYTTLIAEHGRNARAGQADDTRRVIAGENNATRRDVADQGNTTRRDIAGNRDQTQRDIAGTRDATQRRGQDLNRENVQDRVRTQKWSAELSSEWHLRGQDLTHEDRQASINTGLERTRMVQDSINERFNKGQLDKANWQAAGQEVRAVTAKMNAAQRIMNGIQTANFGADVSNNPAYKQAASDYEAAAAKLDFIEQKLDEKAPVDKSVDKPVDGGGKPAAPAPARGKTATPAAAPKVTIGAIVPGPGGKGKFRITRIDKDGTPHGVPVQ